MVEEKRDPRPVPAGMRRPTRRIGRGVQFDGVSGVRPAREEEPVTEADGVVDEPENRGSSDSDAGKPKSRRSQA